MATADGTSSIYMRKFEEIIEELIFDTERAVRGDRLKDAWTTTVNHEICRAQDKVFCIASKFGNVL
jgi:hypothetical protein